MADKAPLSKVDPTERALSATSKRRLPPRPTIPGTRNEAKLTTTEVKHLDGRPLSARERAQLGVTGATTPQKKRATLPSLPGSPQTPSRFAHEARATSARSRQSTSRTSRSVTRPHTAAAPSPFQSPASTPRRLSEIREKSKQTPYILMSKMCSPNTPGVAKILAQSFVNEGFGHTVISQDMIPEQAETRLREEDGIFHIVFKHTDDDKQRASRHTMALYLLFGDRLTRSDGLTPDTRVRLDHKNSNGINGLHKAFLADLKRDQNHPNAPENTKHRYMDLLNAALEAKRITQDEYERAYNEPIPAYVINKTLSLKGRQRVTEDMTPEALLHHLKIGLKKSLPKLRPTPPTRAKITTAPQMKPEPTKEETQTLLSALLEEPDADNPLLHFQLALFQLDDDRQLKKQPELFETDAKTKGIAHIPWLDAINTHSVDATQLPEGCSDNGDTFLHMAVRRQNWALVEALLAWGANPVSENDAKETPFDLLLCHPIHTHPFTKEEYNEFPEGNPLSNWWDCACTCADAVKNQVDQGGAWKNKIRTLQTMQARLLYYANYTPSSETQPQELNQHMMHELELLNHFKEKGIDTNPFIDPLTSDDMTNPHTLKYPIGEHGGLIQTALQRGNINTLDTMALFTLPGLWFQSCPCPDLTNTFPVPRWSITDQGDQTSIGEPMTDAEISPLETTAILEQDDTELSATTLILETLKGETNQFLQPTIWRALRAAAYYAKPNFVRTLLTHDTSKATLSTPKEEEKNRKDQRKIAIQYAIAGFRARQIDGQQYKTVLALLSGLAEDTVFDELNVVIPEEEERVPTPEPEPEVAAMAAAAIEPPIQTGMKSTSPESETKAEEISPPQRPVVFITPSPPTEPPPANRRRPTPRRFTIRNLQGAIVSSPTQNSDSAKALS
ncbi:MAG: hypothetical protein O3A01_09075 [bacterium]|nr:hypothetical protein [bacterium]